MNQDGTSFTVANQDFRKPTRKDLVYFENSPDYCVMDKSAGKDHLSCLEKETVSQRAVYALQPNANMQNTAVLFDLLAAKTLNCLMFPLLKVIS